MGVESGCSSHNQHSLSDIFVFTVMPARKKRQIQIYHILRVHYVTLIL